MSDEAHLHTTQLRVTQDVYELLVQEKRRRRELEGQLARAFEALHRLQHHTAYDEYLSVKACVDHGLGISSELYENWNWE